MWRENCLNEQAGIGLFFLISPEQKSSCVVGVGGTWLTGITGIQWAADMAIVMVSLQVAMYNTPGLVE